jgi:hypothetical protein
MSGYPSNEQVIQLLLSRLERISADSHWAHRASGTRGSLLNALEQYQQGHVVDQEALDFLINHSFFILERAAGGSTYENPFRE